MHPHTQTYVCLSPLLQTLARGKCVGDGQKRRRRGRHVWQTKHTHTHTGTHMSCKWSATTGNRFGTDSNQNKWLTNKKLPNTSKGTMHTHQKHIKKKRKQKKGNKLNNFMLLLIFKQIMRWEGTEGERSRKEGALRTSPNINSNRRTEPQVFKFAALSATCLDTNTVIKPAYIHAHTHTNTHTRLTYTYANIYMHVNTDVHAHKHTHTQR